MTQAFGGYFAARFFPRRPFARRYFPAYAAPSGPPYVPPPSSGGASPCLGPRDGLGRARRLGPEA